MLILSKIFVFELRPTKFGGLVALPEGFPKMPKKWTKVHQFQENWDQISKFDPQYLLPQGVLGGNFVTAR